MELIDNKAYYKSELAMLYGVKWRTIARFIKFNEELKLKLKESGYRNDQKILTPAQVSLINKYYSDNEKGDDEFGIFR